MSHYFLANFDPSSPLSHFVTHRGTPPKVRHTSRTPPFLVGLVQKTRTKTPCTNSLSIVRGGSSEVFSLEGFVRGGFCPFPSVRIHLLLQQVKHHFKFQVS